jgi:hypothetical protein
MKFREHRGSLADSMCTVVDVADRAALIALIRERLDAFHFTFPDDALKIAPYAADSRNGRDTHIVTIDKYGVAGFTNGPL